MSGISGSYTCFAGEGVCEKLIFFNHMSQKFVEAF